MISNTDNNNNISCTSCSVQCRVNLKLEENAVSRVDKDCVVNASDKANWGKPGQILGKTLTPANLAVVTDIKKLMIQ